MSVFFDIILVAIFLLTVIRHARLGLACSVLSAGKIILALIAAIALCYPVASLFYALGMPEAISGIAAFIAIMLVTFLLSGLLIKLLSMIKIPVITRIDKLLGAVLGIILGAILVSMASTAIYTVIELMASLNAESDAMSIYEGSYVFKFIYDLNLFEFLRNLF